MKLLDTKKRTRRVFDMSGITVVLVDGTVVGRLAGLETAYAKNPETLAKVWTLSSHFSTSISIPLEKYKKEKRHDRAGGQKS
jgi:hypothetical protein